MLKGMRRALLALLAAAPLAAAPAAREFTELPPGRYTMTVKGLLCEVCARAVASEFAKLPEVEAATVDRDKARGEITVRLDRTLKTAALTKALRRAEKVANLGGRYETSGIAYRLDAASGR